MKVHVSALIQGPEGEKDLLNIRNNSVISVSGLRHAEITGELSSGDERVFVVNAKRNKLRLIATFFPGTAISETYLRGKWRSPHP